LRAFFERESDICEAQRRAQTNKDFWNMVYSGTGLGYRDLKEMDIREFYEAIEAKAQYIKDRKSQQE
jgi:hypothetical protein